jgi:two-component system, NarL family, sensor kinase
MQEDPFDIVVFLIATSILLLGMILFVIIILFFYKKRQIIYQRELNSLKEDYEKNLLKTQLEIQEQTFQNISQEIHDNISLSLTLVKLNLNTLNLDNKQKTLNQISLSVEFLSKAIDDLNNISHSLDFNVISEQGLIKALEKEIEKIKNLCWHNLNFEISGNPTYMSSHKELVIFRIVQESFNNVLKHANAKSIALKLRYSDTHVFITIIDDGIGFLINAQNPKNGSYTAGLRNMKKRAELINGKFDIVSELGLGTITNIIVPY